MPDKFLVEKEIQFDAGHRVPAHRSKCRNPHGHRYRVVVGVVGELHDAGSDEGMVMDFGDIKAAMMFIHDVYDHSFILHRDDKRLIAAFGYANEYDKINEPWRIRVVDFVPTAEELARHFYNELVTEINGLAWVKVYETPTSVATYPVQRVSTVMLSD